MSVGNPAAKRQLPFGQFSVVVFVGVCQPSQLRFSGVIFVKLTRMKCLFVLTRI